MAIVLEEKKSPLDLTIEEWEAAVEAEETYRDVINYWHFAKYVYGRLKEETESRESLAMGMKRLNTHFVYHWLFKGLTLQSNVSSRISYDLERMEQSRWYSTTTVWKYPYVDHDNSIWKKSEIDRLPGIKIQCYFSAHGFFFKQLEKELSFEEDLKAVVKNIKSKFKKKVSDLKKKLNKHRFEHGEYIFSDLSNLSGRLNIKCLTHKTISRDIDDYLTKLFLAESKSHFEHYAGPFDASMFDSFDEEINQSHLSKAIEDFSHTQMMLFNEVVVNWAQKPSDFLSSHTVSTSVDVALTWLNTPANVKIKETVNQHFDLEELMDLFRNGSPVEIANRIALDKKSKEEKLLRTASHLLEGRGDLPNFIFMPMFYDYVEKHFPEKFRPLQKK